MALSSKKLFENYELNSKSKNTTKTRNFIRENIRNLRNIQHLEQNQLSIEFGNDISVLKHKKSTNSGRSSKSTSKLSSSGLKTRRKGNKKPKQNFELINLEEEEAESENNNSCIENSTQTADVLDPSVCDDDRFLGPSNDIFVSIEQEKHEKLRAREKRRCHQKKDSTCDVTLKGRLHNLKEFFEQGYVSRKHKTEDEIQQTIRANLIESGITFDGEHFRFTSESDGPEKMNPPDGIDIPSYERKEKSGRLRKRLGHFRTSGSLVSSDLRRPIRSMVGGGGDGGSGVGCEGNESDNKSLIVLYESNTK